MSKMKKGFTLVELIVVIGVLALLAVGAIVAFGNVQRNARRSNRRVSATSLSRNLELFNQSASDHSSVFLTNANFNVLGTQLLPDASTGLIPALTAAGPLGTGAGGTFPQAGYRLAAAPSTEVVFILMDANGNTHETTVSNHAEAARLIGIMPAAPGANPVLAGGTAAHDTAYVRWIVDPASTGGGDWRTNEANIMRNDLSP